MARWVWAGLLILLGGYGLGVQASHAAMPPTVRVHLFQAYPSFNEIQLVGPLRVVQPIYQTLGRGVYSVHVAQGHLVFVSGANSATMSGGALMKTRQLIIAPAKAGTISLQPRGLKTRQYRGRVELSVDRRNTLRVVNEVPARDYVSLVLGSETPPGWPAEALKAQAVLTQTRLARYHRGDALSDTTQEEVYGGEAYRRVDVSRAVASVWGQRLMVRGLPITVFYHASCAGHTSDTPVFGLHQHLPGIAGVPCAACKASAFAKPTVKMISRRTFNKAFPAGLPQVLSVDSAGRPLNVRFANGNTESGYAFWLALGQKLGWDKAPGLRFSWVQLPDGRVAITSTGAGHGVGLCQQGAAEMARQGKTYRQILDHYFPKAQLSQ